MTWNETWNDISLKKSGEWNVDKYNSIIKNKKDELMARKGKNKTFSFKMGVGIYAFCFIHE